MQVKRVPAREEMVEVTVTFTVADWERMNTDASWSGMTIEEYMKAAPARRGC